MSIPAANNTSPSRVEPLDIESGRTEFTCEDAYYEPCNPFCIGSKFCCLSTFACAFTLLKALSPEGIDGTEDTASERTEGILITLGLVSLSAVSMLLCAGARYLTQKCRAELRNQSQNANNPASQNANNPATQNTYQATQTLNSQ